MTSPCNYDITHHIRSSPTDIIQRGEFELLVLAENLLLPIFIWHPHHLLAILRQAFILSLFQRWNYFTHSSSPRWPSSPAQRLEMDLFVLIQPVKGMTMLQKRIGQVTALYRMLSTGVTQHQLINPSLRYINYQHHRRSDLFCFYDDDTPFTARAFNPTADWTLFSYSVEKERLQQSLAKLIRFATAMM